MAALTVPLARRGPKGAVAEHPDRAAIEIGLANGVGLKTLAARYGIDASTLSRYRQKMPDDLVTRLRVRPLKSDEELARIREVESRSLMDNLIWQRSRLYANADTCDKLGMVADEQRALLAASTVTERIAKLLGELGTVIRHDHKHLHLAAMPEWHAIRTNLARALRPFPEAHAAAIAAMQGAEATAVQIPALIEGEVSRIDTPRGPAAKSVSGE